MQDTNIPVTNDRLTSPGVRFLIPIMAAPKITGVESRNENLAASSLVKEKALAAVIVIPERETPGMSAIA